MTLHGLRPGVVEVLDGFGQRVAIIEHRTGRRCLDCPLQGGYWIIAGRLDHHHRAVHAFKEVVTGYEM